VVEPAQSGQAGRLEYRATSTLGGFRDRHTLQFVPAELFPHAPNWSGPRGLDPRTRRSGLWPAKSFDARLGGAAVFSTPSRGVQESGHRVEPHAC